MYQLWDDAKVIMHLSNSGMLIFLHLIGMYKGRGLSPFCCDFKTNYNLIVAVDYFFHQRVDTEIQRYIMETFLLKLIVM